MGIFAPLTRRVPTDGPEVGRELDDDVRIGLPHRFEAVGEALSSGSGSVDACAVAGRLLAEGGASLDEVLEELRTTSQAVTGEDPPYAAVRAISVAWSEATLAYLHQMSCEDPLTGLASLAHVRARLAELYRGQFRTVPAVQESHALVVADIRLGSGADHIIEAMRLVRLGQAARTVFAGTETIAQVGTNRIVVVVERDERLGRRVALLRKVLGVADFRTRVWIEGLPPSDAAVAALLDELARP